MSVYEQAFVIRSTKYDENISLFLQILCVTVLFLKCGRLKNKLKQIIMIENFSILALDVSLDTVFYQMLSILRRTALVNRYTKIILLL